MRIFVKEGRLRAIWKVLLYLLAYFLLSIVVQIVVAVLYFAIIFLRASFEAGGAVMPILPGPAPELPLSLLIISTFAGLGVTLLLTWVFRHYLDKESLLDLGLRLRKGWEVQIAFGALLGSLLMAFVFTAEWLGGWLRPLGWAEGLYLPLLGYFLFFTAGAISEELVFRGYTLQTLQQEWGRWGALVVSALLFAIFHGLNLNFSALSLLGIFMAGILLGYAYLLARSLWLPMALHFAWNFAEGPLFSFAVSGLTIDGLLVWETQNPDPLWTGGGFGPEGGLLGLTAVLLGILALRLVHPWFRRGLVIR